MGSPFSPKRPGADGEADRIPDTPEADAARRWNRELKQVVQSAKERAKALGDQSPPRRPKPG